MNTHKLVSYRKVSFLFLLLVCVIFLPGTTAYGVNTEKDNYVYDHAHLLSDTNKKDLEDTIKQIQDKYQVDVILLTIEESLSESTTTYMENFIDEGCDLGFFKEDNVILFINTQQGDRRVEIQGYGTMEDIITYSRIDRILDDVQPLLSDGKYQEAITQFTEHVSYYLKHPNTSLSKNSLFFQFWFQLLISLAIGAITVGIMAFHSSGRVTTNARTYLDSSKSRLVDNRDIYLRTTTTRVRKPQNNGGSKGTGGRSSGGRSHSGGGRSF